ncbi:MAG: hypothetical protein ACFCUQ_01275 [Kiloniellales bacterium]
MPVVPIGYPTLNRADVRAIIARGQELTDPAEIGEWLPVMTEAGDMVVAALNRSNEELVLGFGKEEGWYYAFDADGELLAEGQLIEEVFEALARSIEPPARVALAGR